MTKGSAGRMRQHRPRSTPSRGAPTWQGQTRVFLVPLLHAPQTAAGLNRAAVGTDRSGVAVRAAASSRRDCQRNRRRNSTVAANSPRCS
jgi:hypothetical protein